FLRHALSHLFRGQDPLPERLARCHAPGEAYHVPGLGPGFWSAVVRSLDPETVPHWCPAIERGLARLGVLSAGGRGAAGRFATVQEAWKRARHLAPGLDAAQFAVFLERVSRTAGRELAPAVTAQEAFAWAVGGEQIRQAIREVRTRVPLRKRIRGTPADVI